MQEIMDMRVIGIDTGTTTISGVLVEDGRLTDSVTLKNDTKKESDGYRLQDADRILEHCISVLKRLHAEKADGIALTGQMHGIVYTDAEGHACSDAVSWQDERGNRLYRDQMTYSAYMSRFTGYPAASGYGMVTLFHDTVNGQIPAGAVSFCTIPDYIAMRLCQRKKPLIHTSMAQSLGLYDQRTKGFDLQAADILGLNKQYLPAVTDTVCILGTYQGSIPVLCALGDNQASVYGACAGRSRLLVNIGTGSQISLSYAIHTGRLTDWIHGRTLTVSIFSAAAVSAEAAPIMYLRGLLRIRCSISDMKYRKICCRGWILQP